MRILISATILAAACAPPVMACDMCSVYAAIQAQGGGDKGFFGGIVEQYIHNGTLQNNDQKVANIYGQYLDDSVTTVFAGYKLTERLDLQFNVPIIYRSYQRPVGNTTSTTLQTGTESGLGDASLIGNFVAFRKIEKDFSINWSVLGGVKFPTGDTIRLSDPEYHTGGGSHGFHANSASSSATSQTAVQTTNSGVWSHSLTLGSGSLDGVVGTSVSARWKRWFLNAGVQYTANTEGDYSHQYADDLTWQGGPGFFFALKEDYTLSLQAVVSGDTRGDDTFSGVPDGHSAETIVYLGPQISFTWREKLSVLMAVDVPVSVANDGLQVVPDYKVRAAVRWNF
jgi:hypothetical protein